MFKKLLAASAITFAFSTAAYAGPVHNFEIDNPPGSTGGGDILNINTTFDTNTDTLSWSHTVDTPQSDGFWLVLSDGPNPKNQADQLAIFYGDANANTLTAYVYNGLNSNSSFSSPGIYLETYALSTNVSGGEITYNFDIDVTDLNSQSNPILTGTPGFDTTQWEGAHFGEQIGVWFHPMINSTFTYSGDAITNITNGGQGWYDSNFQTTTAVSEPSALGMLAIGLLGLIAQRRRLAKA